MKTKEVIILDEHSLKNAKIEDNIQKLIVKWGNTISRRDRYLGMTAAIPQVPVPTAKGVS